MTEIEELIQAAEKVLAKLPMPEPVSSLYTEGYIDGMYIQAVIYTVTLW